jgi:hypothetical protein
MLAFVKVLGAALALAIVKLKAGLLVATKSVSIVGVRPISVQHALVS